MNPKKLPLYELVVDDTEETGVDLISLVANPAIEMMGVAFNDHKCGCKKEEFVKPHSGEHEKDFIPRCISKVMNDGTTNDVKQAVAICYSYWDNKDKMGGETNQEFAPSGFKPTPEVHPNCRCKIVGNEWILADDPSNPPCKFCKEAKMKLEKKKKMQKQMFAVVKDQQIIVGPAMIPNFPIYRNDEEGEYNVFFTSDTIKKICNKFLKNGNTRSINVDHTDRMVDAFIQESWIVEDPAKDKSSLYGFDVPAGTWMISLKIEDSSFWDQEVKEEGKYGFSIEGIMGSKLVQASKEMSMEELIDSLTEDEIRDILDEI